MRFVYSDILSYFIVLTLVFVPAELMCVSNIQPSDAQGMSVTMDSEHVKQMDGKCHHGKEGKCCCDSDADQCACVMHLTVSILTKSNLNILNELTNSRFLPCPVGHIQNASTRLLRPPIS